MSEAPASAESPAESPRSGRNGFVMARDEKRLYREIKRDVKRLGNKKRRRFLKDLDADPADFQFGNDASSELNGADGRRRRPESRKESDSNESPA